MTQPSSYASVDDVIRRWAEASGSPLFTEWANEPARFFYLTGLRDFECFQISISPPSPGDITVTARSVDTNDDEELERTWNGSPTDLAAMLASAIAEIELWKHRPLAKPVRHFPTGD